MSVTMDPTLGGQQFEDFEFHGREAIVKFKEFGRDEHGEIRVLEKPVFDYVQDAGGQWLRKGATAEEGPTPVSIEEVEYQDNIYWQFEIVSPLDLAGKCLPLRGALKGIVVKRAPDGRWHFNMTRRSMGFDNPVYKTGLWVIAEKCGFILAAFDDDSQMHDPGYLAEGLEMLNHIVQADLPLRREDVLEHMVEAKLKEAAERGLLLKVKTGERANFIQYGSVSPLTADQAARFQQAATAGQDEAEVLRDKVRAMIPTDADERKGFLKKVHAEASALHPGGVTPSGMLAALTADELKQLVAKLSPVEEGEMTL